MVKAIPNITVIVPAYNEEKLIALCLDALQKQTYPKDKYRVIVVDNNSSDKTAKIASKFPVTVLHYKKMNTVAAARQFGASKTSSPILAFMDGDSFADPTWLSTIAKVMQKKGTVAVCGVGLPSQTNSTINFLFQIYNYSLRICQFFGLVLPWGFNFAIKKSAFDQIGGYDLSLRSSDDVELGMRISKTFGKKSIRYIQELKVYTSTRKQESLSNFILLMWDSMRNFTNLIVLKNAKPVTLRNVR